MNIYLPALLFLFTVIKLFFLFGVMLHKGKCFLTALSGISNTHDWIPIKSGCGFLLKTEGNRWQANSGHSHEFENMFLI